MAAARAGEVKVGVREADRGGGLGGGGPRRRRGVFRCPVDGGDVVDVVAV